MLSNNKDRNLKLFQENLERIKITVYNSSYWVIESNPAILFYNKRKKRKTK